MRIAKLNAIVLRFPHGDFFGGKGTAAGAFLDSDVIVQPGWRGIFSTRIQTTLVRIETEDGIVGYGEAHSPIAPKVTAEILVSILRPMLIGQDASELSRLWRFMYDAMTTRGHVTGFMLDAISGVDSALWDIKGKAMKTPVSSLLGGTAELQLPAYMSGIRGAEDADRLEFVREGLDRGFETFKYFTGNGLKADKTTLSKLRETFPAVDFAADNLWNYSFPEALDLGRHLEQMRAAWYEAPIDPEDIEGNARLCAKLDLPIANCETERTRYQVKNWLVKDAVDIVQPDVGRCGVSEAIHICHLAEAFHRRVALHAGVCSPSLIAASLHVAAACNNVKTLEFQPTCLDLGNRILRTPIRCTGGRFQIPQGPGFGIEYDEEALGCVSEVH
jgi:galactonate dehydratase